LSHFYIVEKKSQIFVFFYQIMRRENRRQNEITCLCICAW